LLLEGYAPACVLVSEKGEGLYFHGQTGKYLHPPLGGRRLEHRGHGARGIATEPRQRAAQEVVAQRKAICYENLRVKINGGSQLINLTVRPVSQQAGWPNAMLIVFEDVAPQEPVETAEPSEEGDRRVSDLQWELRSTEEHLQTTIGELETSNEELKSINEELPSSNEELQSTNEELETSKEELQSVNEELVTVNSEHEIKLEELARANKDMANLRASTDIGTIFLDMELRIQRFTPAATRVVKLIETDIGRPISDIASSLDDEFFAEDVKEALATLASKEREVKTREGAWYSVRIRPYRTDDNVIEGAAIAFVDITGQKRPKRDCAHCLKLWNRVRTRCSLPTRRGRFST
jgi:two-component system CheB/CheR fusion protein